jgi:hypothetical protein
MTPLEYMLKVMRDPAAEEGRRDEMARAAAPYLHPKLQSITHKGKIGVVNAELLSDNELAGIVSRGRRPEASPSTPDPKKIH